jgi:hypothetical protein
MPKRVGGFTSEEIENIIVHFLNLKEEAYFGEIQKHLENKGINFSNSKKDTSGLRHTLNRMNGKKIRKLEKNSHHQYPRYVSMKQSNFSSSLEGYLFRYHAIENMSFSRNDLFKEILEFYQKENLSEDEVFILKHMHSLGFLFLHLLLLSYVRSFDSNLETEKNKKMHTAWVNNALDFNNQKNNIQKIFEFCVKQYCYEPEMWENKNSLDRNFFNDSVIQEKMFDLKKLMDNMFPETMELFKNTEDAIDDRKEEIKKTWLESKEDLPLREF